MRLEDENFEEEFMKWLKSKTKRELVESLKKYAINNNENIYTIKNMLNIGKTNIYIKVKSQKIKLNEEIKNITLSDKFIKGKGENKEWKKEPIIVA